MIVYVSLVLVLKAYRLGCHVITLVPKLRPMFIATQLGDVVSKI